ncbi:MAG: glycosyltransferase [Thermoanaerobaculia bacterium]|nr:glycosyltransferase [Thermoanaerobaculia bacterium]
MKILHLSDVYFPRVNGVSTSIATFVPELEALGHRCHLVAPRYGDEADVDGITRVNGRRVPFDPEDRIAPLGAFLGFGDRFVREGYDLIHVQTPFNAHRAGVRLGERLGVPVVETYHTYFEEYFHCYVPFVPRKILSGIARGLSRRQCNQVDAVVVPSRAMADALRDYGVTTRLERIPTGLRPEDFNGGNGTQFRERYRIHDDRPTLVHIGRLAHEKNVDFILRVLRRVADEIPDVLLVIAGEGPAQPSLRRLAESLGLTQHVLFVGYLDRGSDLLDCYRSADAFVFASRTETQGLVLLEAMALCVPVVSTAVMGTKDILEPGKGCLVAEEDEGDFSAKVLRVLRDPETRNALRREARDYALGEWCARTMAQRMVSLYESLIQQRVDEAEQSSEAARDGKSAEVHGAKAREAA